MGTCGRLFNEISYYLPYTVHLHVAVAVYKDTYIRDRTHTCTHVQVSGNGNTWVASRKHVVQGTHQRCL